MFSEYENLESYRLIQEDGLVDYTPHFLDAKQSEDLLKRLLNEAFFEQNEITLFGNTVKVPRLEAYFALNGEQYGYSGQVLKSQKFPKYLDDLRRMVEQKTAQQYNALLVNYYRNGKDSNGWHADNEKSLGRNPSIASISLGATRRFDLRHLKSCTVRKIMLENGSLLHMHGELQHHYKHQLPKIKALTSARINLTFRWVKPSH